MTWGRFHNFLILIKIIRILFIDKIIVLDYTLTTNKEINL